MTGAQEFYGTVLYFWSFFYNARWKAHGWQGARVKIVLATVSFCFFCPASKIVLATVFLFS
jgi:hypothetical protein